MHIIGNGADNVTIYKRLFTYYYYLNEYTYTENV